MNIIGITGSSGAGKSTVCDILQEEYQVKVINADKIAKELSKRGTSYLDEIIEKFGKDIVDENGELKRKKLAEIIYNNFEKRKLLNLCTFKYIKKEDCRNIRDGYRSRRCESWRRHMRAAIMILRERLREMSFPSSESSKRRPQVLAKLKARLTY